LRKRRVPGLKIWKEGGLTYSSKEARLGTRVRNSPKGYYLEV